MHLVNFNFPLLARLLFAGEHTHPTQWSFMHGARASGVREADRIIARQNKFYDVDILVQEGHGVRRGGGMLPNHKNNLEKN